MKRDDLPLHELVTTAMLAAPPPPAVIGPIFSCRPSSRQPSGTSPREQAISAGGGKLGVLGRVVWSGIRGSLAWGYDHPYS